MLARAVRGTTLVNVGRAGPWLSCSRTPSGAAWSSSARPLRLKPSFGWAERGDGRRARERQAAPPGPCLHCPRRCCRRYRRSRWTGSRPSWRSTPPKKNLMKVGMGTWVLRGIAARSHGGHRVRFAPFWIHGISLGPSWDRLEVVIEMRGHTGSSSGHGVMPGSS